MWLSDMGAGERSQIHVGTNLMDDSIFTVLGSEG